jgi:hypothetical protein
LDVCVADRDINITVELLLSRSDWDPYEYPYEELLFPAKPPRDDSCNNLVLSFKLRGFSAIIRIWRMSVCYLNPRSNNYLEDRVLLDATASTVLLRYPTLDQMLSALYQWISDCKYGPHRLPLMIDIEYLIRYNMRTVLRENYAEEFISELYRAEFKRQVLRQKAHPKHLLQVRMEGGEICRVRRFKFEGPDGYFVDRNGDPETPVTIHE